MTGKGGAVQSGAIRSEMSIIGGTNNKLTNHQVGRCEDQNAPNKEKKSPDGKNNQLWGFSHLKSSKFLLDMSILFLFRYVLKYY